VPHAQPSTGANSPAEGPLSSLTRSTFPYDPPGELSGGGRSYGLGPGSVEFEAAGPIDELVDPGVDVVHGRGQRCQLRDGFLLLPVRRDPVVGRSRGRGLPASVSAGFMTSTTSSTFRSRCAGSPVSACRARIETACRLSGWIGSGRCRQRHGQRFCLPVSLQGLLEPDAVKVASPVLRGPGAAMRPAYPPCTPATRPKEPT